MPSCILMIIIVIIVISDHLIVTNLIKQIIHGDLTESPNTAVFPAVIMEG